MADRSKQAKEPDDTPMPSFDLLSYKTGELRCRQQAEAMRLLSKSPDLAVNLSNLARGQTYRVVLSQPIRGSLNVRTDGILDAFVKAKDGKVLAVARLQKAGSALIGVATALAGHAMLVQISAQLDHLKSSVDQVLAKMEAQRLGKIDAKLAFLANAHHYRPEHHTPMLLDAAKVLSEELAGTIRDVRQGIALVPKPQSWNLSRAVWDTTGSTAEALDRVQSTMQAMLLCLSALGQVHQHLNDEIGAANIMDYWLNQALSLPLERAEFLARCLPIVKEEDRRDRFWIDTRRVLERMLDIVADTLDPDRPNTVQFDIDGAELVAFEMTAPDALPLPDAPILESNLRADPNVRRHR
jgi:hypothetical protein